MATVIAAPGEFARILAGADGSERHPDLTWPVVAYVCHVSDNLRIWAERLAGLALGEQRPVAPYDQDRLAQARRYDGVALAGALWSLDRAVSDWQEAVLLVDQDAITLIHPERHEQTLLDVVRSNAHDAFHHCWDVRRTIDKADSPCVTMELVGQAQSGRLRQVIEGLAADSTVVSRLDGSMHNIFPVAVGPSEGAALRDWVIREGALHTIEIGLGYAISALYICEGLLSTGGADPRHVVIDPYQESRFRNCGLQVLNDAGVADLVDHYAEESQSVLPRLLSEGRRFDLAFVDGNHRFDWVFVDLFYLGRLLRPGAVVFVDDYQLPGVARAAAFFLSNVGWTLESVSSDHDLHHWAVLRTSETPDTRPFTHFVDF